MVSALSGERGAPALPQIFNRRPSTQTSTVVRPASVRVQPRLTASMPVARQETPVYHPVVPPLRPPVHGSAPNRTDWFSSCFCGLIATDDAEDAEA